jgi:hypothetical protein
MDEATEMFVFARTGSTDIHTFVMINVDCRALISFVNQKVWCFFSPKRRNLFVAPWIGVGSRAGIELGAQTTQLRHIPYFRPGPGIALSFI